MDLITAMEASLRVQPYWPGAYDFERVVNGSGVKCAWTFRCQGGDTGWVLNDGTVCTQPCAYRWHAEDVALEWSYGLGRTGPAAGTG